MKLHLAPGGCSLAPHIAARELGLPLEIAVTDFGPAFFEINPKGLVPALQLDDGAVLTETPVILQFLADLAPQGGLLPTQGLGRYRVLEWLSYVATEIQKGFGHPKYSDESRDCVLTRMNTRFGFIDAHLAKQPSGWLAESFSVADISLFVVTRWPPLIGMDRTIWPALEAHFARVAARPATQAALAAEGIAP